MRISMVAKWSFWGSSREALEKEPEKKVADVDLEKGRASTSTNCTFSPLRLLLLAHLFWAVRGQGLGPYPAAFDLSTLNGANGFAIAGEVAGDKSGWRVSSGGDLNGDGLSDLVIGVSRASPSGKMEAGKGYVLFGTHTPIPRSLFDFSTLNGINGFAFSGEAAGDRCGNSVSSAGDVNGDGLSDIVVGAYKADPSGKSDAGKSYVIYGSRTPMSGGQFNLSALNGTNGFTIAGESASDHSGTSVFKAGDVNGDGLSDLVIGAHKAAPSGRKEAGKSYVIFGRRTRISGGQFDLSNLDGKNGFAISGLSARDQTGNSVSSAGDVNGDGLSDLLIGAYVASPSNKVLAGKSYVIFGSHTPISSGQFELSTLNGSNGFVILGESTDDRSGVWVSSAGDVNGDGLSDLVIGAYFASPSGKKQAGKSYVFFGSRTSIPGGQFDLSSFNGSNGFAIPGEAAYDRSGISVSTAGDVNGDGLDDFVIGAYQASFSGKMQAGKSYIIYGSRKIIARGIFELSTLNGTNGFVILGEAAGDQSGISVSSAGDVNGDGISDLVIGANFASPLGKDKAGKSYIIFGRNLTSIAPLPTIQVSQSTFTFTASRMDPPNTTTPIVAVTGSSPSSSTLLIGGLVFAVSAIAYSLMGGFVFLLKKRSGVNESFTSPQPHKPNQEIPADYVDIGLIAPNMRSIRVENKYAIIQTKEASGYSQWPSQPASRSTDQYDDVDLEKLNAQMGQYEDAKKAQLHDGYDDLPTV